MFYRKILDLLKKWQANPDRKPLVLRGAHQVGKTTVVNMFAKEFDNYIYLNLDQKNERDFFNESLSIQEIFQTILLTKNIILKKGTILLFIDSIHHSQTAVKMLRYFYEDLKELHVIAADSLYEVLHKKARQRFPAESVELLYLYPLSFEEFLMAKNENSALDAYHTIPLPPFAHEQLLNLFHEYALIGGMPGIVQKYLTNANISTLAPLYKAILTLFLNDTEKYHVNPRILPIIQSCIESIPFESGKRSKFQKFGHSSYRSRDVGEALRKIEKTMLIDLIYPSTSTQIPIKINNMKTPKLQLVDTGILAYFVGLQSGSFRFDDLYDIYDGLIVKHIARQELNALNMIDNKKVPFWIRDKKQSTAEVDFVMPFQDLVIPAIIRPGKSGSIRSLHQFVSRCDHPYAVRLYAGALQIANALTQKGKPYKLLDLPYFLAAKLSDYIELLVGKSRSV